MADRGGGTPAGSASSMETPRDFQPLTEGDCTVKLTMTVLAATLVAGTALAQTTAPTTPGGSNPAVPGAGLVGQNTGTAPASGNRNQAVATTGANAPEPARGASSFTEAQARGRIEDKGFSAVTGLAKGDDGIWRGAATKGGTAGQVWLDYKGNIGQGAGTPAAGTAAQTPSATGASR